MKKWRNRIWLLNIWLDNRRKSDIIFVYQPVFLIIHVLLYIVSIKESKHFASDMSVSGFFVGEDSNIGGENNTTELSGWEDVVGPLLELLEGNIISGRDDSTLVNATWNDLREYRAIQQRSFHFCDHQRFQILRCSLVFTWLARTWWQLWKLVWSKLIFFLV